MRGISCVGEEQLDLQGARVFMHLFNNHVIRRYMVWAAERSTA
jgi:hypothetical protein